MIVTMLGSTASVALNESAVCDEALPTLAASVAVYLTIPHCSFLSFYAISLARGSDIQSPENHCNLG